MGWNLTASEPLNVTITDFTITAVRMTDFEDVLGPVIQVFYDKLDGSAGVQESTSVFIQDRAHLLQQMMNSFLLKIPDALID